MKSRLHAHIGTFRQLEILLAVYDTKSISAAAKELHLTQPTVSMQLSKLSKAVDMPLYSQIGRNIVFTEAGLLLVEGAREILGITENLDMSLSNLRGIQTGTLKIGVVSTAKYFIPHLLGDFCKDHPNVDIQLNVGNRSQIIERLWAGRDDFCVFSHPPQSDQLELIDFLPNPLVAITSEAHKLATQERVTLQEFAQQAFIMREPGSGTRLTIEDCTKQLGIRFNVKMTIESNEAIKHAVMSDLGVSVLSKHTLTFGGASGLKILDIDELPFISKWYIARPKSLRSSVLADTFIEFIKTEGREKILSTL